MITWTTANVVALASSPSITIEVLLNALVARGRTRHPDHPCDHRIATVNHCPIFKVELEIDLLREAGRQEREIATVESVEIAFDDRSNDQLLVEV